MKQTLGVPNGLVQTTSWSRSSVATSSCTRPARYSSDLRRPDRQDCASEDQLTLPGSVPAEVTGRRNEGLPEPRLAGLPRPAYEYHLFGVAVSARLKRPRIPRGPCGPQTRPLSPPRYSLTATRFHAKMLLLTYSDTYKHLYIYKRVVYENTLSVFMISIPNLDPSRAD